MHPLTVDLFSSSGAVAVVAVAEAGLRCLEAVPVPVRVAVGGQRVALLLVQVPEELPQVLDVGAGLELEATTVGQVLGELLRAARAEGVDGRGLLLLHDHFVLPRRVAGLEALPRQAPLEEVHQHVPHGLEVVAPRLFDAQVVVDGRVPRRAREGLADSVRASVWGLRYRFESPKSMQ